MTYEHRQFGLVTTLALAGGLALCTVLTLVTGQWQITGAVGGIVSIALVLFHAITVTVDGKQVQVLYGFGPLRFRWSLSSVQAVSTVRNKWWYGWGIKLTPYGWLYNVSGLDAVEIEFDSGKRVRIGTDEPERLARALETAAGLSRR